MRLVQLSVPDERRDDVVAHLRDQGIGYSIVPGGAEYDDRSYVSFVVPADAVEHVLEDLAAVGYEREWFTVAIETEFADFEGRDELQAHWANTPNKIAPRTLRSKVVDMRYNTRAYLWMMVLSAIVAVAGILLASPAVVVGSMVLAPIVSPMLTASVGAVRGDQEMLYESVKMQVLGLGVAALAATAFSLLLKWFFAVPRVLAVASLELVALRISPGMLSVAVGLAAGAAGAFGLATKGQVSIVGVMIAAALIPTAGVAGIGFAWMEFQVGLGALVLLFITIVAVNVGAFLMLWYLGYRAEASAEKSLALDSPGRAVSVAATLVVVVAILLFVGVGFYQQSTFEREANAAVTDVLNRGGYDDLGVVETSYEYTGIGPFTSPTTVTYTLRRTSDRGYASLPARFEDRIAAATSRDVVVQIRFVDYRVAGTETTAADRSTETQTPALLAPVG
ncbi:DUF389 domain-containing protein [Halorientalis halophila]|uniref:DUF389 domain-containing protein n=1 Tax=Halorientalis halophila TaxID=3108499 RepID=UPI00300BAFDB